MASLRELRVEAGTLLREFCATIEMPAAQLDHSQRELIATLGFGMILALAHERKLLAPQTQILNTALLEDVFQYSSQDAIDFAAFLMRASAEREVHPLSHEIVGLGEEAYGHWVGQDDEALSQVIIKLLDLVKAHTTAE